MLLLNPVLRYYSRPSSASTSRTLLSAISLTRTHTNTSFLTRRSFKSSSAMATPAEAVETAKRFAAIRAVRDHFDPTAEYVGIGSGSTIVYVVQAIKAMPHDLSRIKFVPTGYQSRQVIVQHGLTPISFDSVPPNKLLDVAFDGADEVDEDLNCIKGGGACLYQEKLVAMQAKKFICVADHRKLQPRLLSMWPTIPIEVEPLAVNIVLNRLKQLGSTGPFVRPGSIDKAGPIKTDQDNFIVDAPFKTLLTSKDIAAANSLHDAHKGLTGQGEDGVWEVEKLSREIKLIQGVLDVGIFSGEDGVEAAARGAHVGGAKPVAAYFGMADGSVTLRIKGKELETLST